MHDKSSALSSTGVGVAILGTAMHDYALQIVGLVVTIVVHFLTERSKRVSQQRDDRVAQYWRNAALELSSQMDKLRAELAVLKHEPAVIVPPFLPAEAAGDV